MTENQKPAEVILVKYGEIALKGQNKRTFEEILIKNIKRRLQAVGIFTYERMQSTLYIYPAADCDVPQAIQRLLTVFGIGAIQRCMILPKDFAVIAKAGMPYLSETLRTARTFKVEAKRADKAFPMKTPDIQRELGAAILSHFPHLRVDVHQPEVTVWLEIRDKGAYLNALRLTGAGGMPVGSSGAGLLLLSGGIDSPVAAYMMAKRGLRIDAVHFESPPYTSPRALKKVETLCEKLTAYCGDIRLHCVNFTPLQEALQDNCEEAYFTIMMRRLMMQIANRLCDTFRYHALITGESLGQVASQTLMAMNCTDKVARYPVFRPVVGMDKIEIVEIARKIDTFETSILPYEDCCTVFTPKHPKTKPQVAEAEAIEAKFDYQPLIEAALQSVIGKKFNI